MSSPLSLTAPSISAVQLDGLVLLNIIQHGRDSFPDAVSGQLLGLDTSSALEVTSSFPVPTGLSGSQEESYQLEMMKALRMVNVDTNTVGWYQTSIMGSFFTPILIEAQFAYQRHIPNSVVIIYDPILTQRGHLLIRAYRLTQKFMNVYVDKDKQGQGQGLTQERFAEANLESKDIFEELPIKIHNAHLVHGFLYELRESKKFHIDDERLSLQHGPYIERAITTLLFENIDEFVNEQNKFQYYQRSLARQKQMQQSFISQLNSENEVKIMQGKPLTDSDLILQHPEALAKHPLFKPLPKPDRLGANLALAQIAEAERLIIEQSRNALIKLMVVDAVHSKQVTSYSKQS